MDLVFANGTVAFDGIEASIDIGVRDGLVVALGQLHGVQAKHVIDCTGKLIFPGCVDLGLNLLDNGPDDPECSVGLAACAHQAALGGVTTLISTMEIESGESVPSAVRAQAEVDQAKSIVDFGYHLLVSDWTEEIAHQAREAVAAGIPSFWIPRTVAPHALPSPGLMYAAALGLPADTLVIVSPDSAVLVAAERRRLGAAASEAQVFHGGLEANFLASLPRLLRAARPRVLLNGITSSEAVTELARAREVMPGLSAAVQLPALCYTAPEDGGMAVPVWPPVRLKSDTQSLFLALEDGLISAVVSSHKPRSHGEWLAPPNGRMPFGIGTLQHFLPLVYSEGVAKWRLSAGALSQALCADPAKLAGLYPRKGTLLPGSDADLVIIDPARARPIVPTTAAATPFDLADPLAEASFQGCIEAVYRRGVQITNADGVISSGSGNGQFLPRKLSLK